MHKCVVIFACLFGMVLIVLLWEPLQVRGGEAFYERCSGIHPLPFNIFISYIFHFIVQCILYNYADDNTCTICYIEKKKAIF